MRLRALPALLTTLLLLVAGCADDPGPDQAGPPADGDTNWRQLPDAPLTGRTGASVVGVGDRAYVFGGWEFLCPPNADCATPTGPPFADGAVVDVTTGEWSPMAQAPSGLAYAPTAVLGDHIYVVASCAPGVDCPHPRGLLAYDTTSDAWADLGPLPEGVGGQLVATDHGLLALAGTEENGDVADAVYDPDAATWTTLPEGPLPPSYDRFAVADGDRLLVFGSPVVGPDEEGQAKVGAAYDLVAGTWTELPASPGPGYQVWRAGDRAFLNPHYQEDGGGVLDLVSGTWGPFPDGPDDPEWRGDLAGLVSADGATYEYSEGWVFDARDDEWLHVPPREGEVYDDSRGAVGTSLVVFGGQTWADGDGRLLSETWVWEP
jgi:hypothetical protein